MESQSSWPGARSPTHQDVPQASEHPDSHFLGEFRTALLAHEDARGYQRRLVTHPSTNSELLEHNFFTYPLAVLKGFPGLPPDEQCREFCERFATTFLEHAFVKPIFDTGSRIGPSPPYLDIAKACIGSALSSNVPQTESTSVDFFVAGSQLTKFMVEVDNRHSRVIELPASVSILSATLISSKTKSRLAGIAVHIWHAHDRWCALGLDRVDVHVRTDHVPSTRNL